MTCDDCGGTYRHRSWCYLSGSLGNARVQDRYYENNTTHSGYTGTGTVTCGACGERWLVVAGSRGGRCPRCGRG